MKKKIVNRWTRKVHRYLGLILGIQFLAWTIGGLYFSWTKIEQIRGNDLKADSKPLPIQSNNLSLNTLLDSLLTNSTSINIKNIQVVAILGKAYYQIQLQKPKEKVLLFEMKNLALKSPLNEQEAKEVAVKSLKTPSDILKIEYLTSTNGHHEYREKPLPAYAVTLYKVIALTLGGVLIFFGCFTLRIMKIETTLKIWCYVFSQYLD